MTRLSSGPACNQIQPAAEVDLALPPEALCLEFVYMERDRLSPSSLSDIKANPHFVGPEPRSTKAPTVNRQ